MPAVLALVLISAGFAGIFGYQARRLRSAVPARPAGTATVPARRIPTLMRSGRVGEATLSDPARVMVRVAPAESPSMALEVVAADGTVQHSVTAATIVMARGWSRGHPALAFGESRRDFGPFWALGPALAGWELHVVTTTGTVLRCYGSPGSSIDRDLSELHGRLHGALLAKAS